MRKTVKFMPPPGVRHNAKERASGATSNQRPRGRGEKSTGCGGRGSATGSEKYCAKFLASASSWILSLIIADKQFGYLHN